MARPKRGEPGYEEATKKWKQSIIAKYGSVHEYMAKIGGKGGAAGCTGGFASEVVGKDGLTGLERARIAGAKGGKISKRGPSKPKTYIFAEDDD